MESMGIKIQKEQNNCIRSGFAEGAAVKMSMA